MMNPVIRFIRKYIGMLNQRGSARLYGSLIISFLIVAPVLVYHIVTSPTRAPRQVQTSEVATRFQVAQLFPQNLPPLQGVLYEIFVTDDANRRFSLGKFKIRDTGVVVDQFGREIQGRNFNIPEQVDSISSAAIFLTDGTSGGFNVPFLSGSVTTDRVLFEFKHVDPAQASGKFMLGTPTDNNTFVNERSGLWFGNILSGVAGLNLPPLPSGWVYEGWAIVGGSTLTTGRFNIANRPDTFSGFSDNQAPAPKFPGEDFLRDPPVVVFPNLRFPVDLNGQTVVITVEPDRKGTDPTGAGPFPLKILTAEVSRRAEPYRLYDLDQVDKDSFPRATMVFR